MKQNKNGRCFLFRFFSKQTMKHGDLLNDLPNPCNCETSLFSRTTHFTSKLISFSNFFLHRRSGHKDFYFEILVAQRWHILLLNFSDYYFFFLRLRSQTGSSRFANSKLEPARALDPRRWPKGSKLWERERVLVVCKWDSSELYCACAPADIAPLIHFKNCKACWESSPSCIDSSFVMIKSKVRVLPKT